jgi:tripartite-type tricarboxylate transporter receptor subunit TctC
MSDNFVGAFRWVGGIMRYAIFAVAIGATLAGAGSAKAQEWPTRPVTMVVTYAPGGTGDTMGRILAARLSELLSQQVIIENIGGAGGMTGVNRVVKAAPDGYQFALGDVGPIAQSQSLHKNPAYNSATDLSAVVLIATLPSVLVTRKGLPVSNLQEFIAYAKANQGQTRYGSPGVGSLNHLACALLNNVIGVDATHVPYRGGAPAMQDLVAGRIDYQCTSTVNAAPQIEGNQIKGIAVLTRERSARLPDLATAQEEGLAGVEAYLWFGLFLPKSTPAVIVQKLHDATVATMNTPVVQARLKDIGAELVEPERRSPEYVQKFVESELEKWAGLIKAAGLAGQQ